MKEPDNPQLDGKISGAPNLDKAFVEVIDLILRDYVDNWYKHISLSPNFNYEVRQAIYKVLSNISTRCRNLDWISVITEDLPNEIRSHIRLYRLSSHLCRRSKDKNLHDEFFSLESEADKEYCRQKICTDPTAEKDYLSSVSEFILYIITSSEEFNVPPLRYFLREILINAILLPTLNMVTDPDFINQYIVWMCKDNSYSSEYFIQAVRMSENPDEIKAVMERLEMFTSRLRSKDIGGDDDALIKAQIGSIEFVRKICQFRLNKLGEPKNKEEDILSLGKSISSIKMSSITLEFILEREIGVSLFLEFLTSIDSQNFMTIYLNILQFRSNHIKLNENNEDDIFSFEERLEKSDEFYSISFNELLDYARKIHKDAQDLKISDKLLSEIELKIKAEQLTENIFDDVLKELVEILHEKQYFENFKRSHYFQLFLEEIDFLRDDSLISEEEGFDANLLIEGELNGSVVNQPNSDTDSYTVRIVDAVIVNNNYVLYTLVIIKTDKYGQKETWKTQRRYRDFDTMHSEIINKCGKISQLRLPAKKPFNNMANDFLEKRSVELQEYLNECFKPKLLQTYPVLKSIIVKFVQRDSNNRPPLNRIQSIVNPFKSVLSLQETVLGNFKQIYSTISPTKKVNLQSLHNNTNLSNDQSDFTNDQNKAENIPFRILFSLVDEIFDLQNKSQMVRRGILGILRRIVKAFFGIKVNKIILEKAAKSTSADQVAELVLKFKDNWWPNGKLSTSSNPRDKMTKLRTCVLCRTKMLGSISDEVSQFLGHETTRQGVQRVFNLCQDQVLNRRLAHSIFQLIVQKIFPGHNFEKLMQFKLCPAANGKVCDKHNLNAPEWRDWGCL